MNRTRHFICCSSECVKLYDLLVDGYHTPLTGVQIAELFHAGRLRRNDPCKEAGQIEFRTLDELFPLLKYNSTESTLGFVRGRPERTRSVFDGSDVGGDEARPPTSSLKAGWICFGLGLLVSWIFPLGNAFFSIAIITAIVAMCTHQVNRGLVLLLSSFLGIALSALVFFTLVAGAIATVGTLALKQTAAEMKRIEQPQPKALAQLNASNQQLQTLMSSRHASNPPAHPVPPRNTPRPRELGITTEATRLAAQAEQDRAKTREAIRQTELQRDRSNEKEKHIERCKSLSIGTMNRFGRYEDMAATTALWWNSEISW